MGLEKYKKISRNELRNAVMELLDNKESGMAFIMINLETMDMLSGFRHCKEEEGLKILDVLIHSGLKQNLPQPKSTEYIG